MTRNLKALGLALAAMLALGAIGASGASAQVHKQQGELTSDGPVTLTGTEVGEPTENRLTAFGKFVQCPGSTYTGHAVGGGFLPGEGSTTATITPHYKQVDAEGNPNCRGTLNTQATVDMNGCDYVIHLGKTTPVDNTAGTYGVTFDVVCPAEKDITVTVWTNGAAHNEGNRLCTLHVPAQEGLTGAHATDEGNGHVRLAGTVEGITATQTKGPDDFLFNACPNNQTNAAKFDLNVTVGGHNELGEATGISISEV